MNRNDSQTLPRFNDFDRNTYPISYMIMMVIEATWIYLAVQV